ncbi:MAG: serine/threonine-protein kinase [Candidatus Polarisedimenticolia bacterium]
MSERDEMTRLMPLATRVSDGGVVDWATLRSSETDPEARALIHELELVSSIMAAHPAATPRRIWGHLELIEAIGEGTGGIVYRARDAGLQSEVALKLLHPPFRPDRTGPVEEGRLLARVRHPHVVIVHGADCIDGLAGIWMELLRGQTLEEALSRNGPLGHREAALIGVDLCGALAAIHAAGLLHRDVKTRNVMREEGGRIVLMDFSSAREAPAAAGPLEENIRGTPLYMAPELLAGGPPSVQSDLYSLGVVLYHLVTGRYPVPAKTLPELRQAHEERRGIPLRQARPDVPQTFAAVVERAIAADRAHRFPSVSHFEQALAATLGQDHSLAMPEPARSPRVAPWIAAALALVATLVLTWQAGWLPGSSTTRPYSVRAAMQRRGGATLQPLTPGSAVAPGDQLALEFEASVPLHVYVINEDERGESYLLFPLPGLEPQNPLPAGRLHRLPGTSRGSPTYWGISSAGGREHFLIVASRERLFDLESDLEAFPRPRAGSPLSMALLSPSAGERLRGAGILVVDPDAGPGPGSPGSRLNRLAASLAGGPETASGTWIRRIELDNPGR